MKSSRNAAFIVRDRVHRVAWHGRSSADRQHRQLKQIWVPIQPV